MTNKIDYRHGHRGRVRERFLREGLDHFAEYEILELLLFFCVPRRDTKGMAHALMDHFPTLYHVLTASEEELCCTPGIGAHTAHFLRSLLPFARYILKEEPRSFSCEENKNLVSFFQDLYRKEADASIIALFLNNRRDPIRAVTLYKGDVPFNRETIKGPALLAEAYGVNTPAVALAYRKDDTIPLPSLWEQECIEQLRKELKQSGVVLEEVVCFSKNQYNLILNFMRGAFLRSEDDSPTLSSTPLLFPEVSVSLSREKLLDFLETFMNEESAREATKLVLDTYPTLGTISSIPYDFLTEKDGIPQNVALLFKVLGGVYGRAMLSLALSDRAPLETDEAIGSLFSNVIGWRDRETMALLMLDEDKRIKGFRLLGEGTVSTAIFAVRSLTEELIRNGAHTIAIAHNHPGGSCIPSSPDLVTTDEIKMASNDIGVGFLDHFVVTDRGYCTASDYRQKMQSLKKEKSSL